MNTYAKWCPNVFAAKCGESNLRMARKLWGDPEAKTGSEVSK